jgi:hypothetical protein
MNELQKRLRDRRKRIRVTNKPKAKRISKLKAYWIFVDKKERMKSKGNKNLNAWND